jgi:hypothetical protein
VANIVDYLDIVEEDMMKSMTNPRRGTSGLKGLAIRLVAFAVVLYALILLPCGCSSCEQPGETVAEGRRRHRRVRRINRQEMMADIDKVLLLDRPSKLTDKRIP